MIYLNFSISNPFSKGAFKPLYNKELDISKNKTFEFSVTYYPRSLLDLYVDTSVRGSDHAGPSIIVALFGVGISVAISDKRHWDHINDTWGN